MQFKKLGIMSAAACIAIAISAPTAQAAGLLPDNTPGGGGGGCTLSVSGSPGIESYTGYITDSCGYSVRVWVSCIFVFDGMTDRSTHYSGSTTAVSGSEKASCDVTDSITGYGWQYNAGYGWLNG